MRVAGYRLQYRNPQRGPQIGLVARYRVLQLQQRRAAGHPHPGLRLGRRRRITDDLLHPLRRQRVPDSLSKIAVPVRRPLRHRTAHHADRHFVVTNDPADLFGDVLGNSDVRSPVWRRHVIAFFAHIDAEAQRRQRARHLLIGIFDAHHPPQLLFRQHNDAVRLVAIWKSIKDSLRRRPAADIEDQLRRTPQRDFRKPGPQPFLETQSSFGLHIQSGRGGAIVRAVEVRRLQQHIHRGVTDLGVGPAHDTGEADRLLRVGDHQCVAGQLAVFAVQRCQMLAFDGPANDDLVVHHGVEIEGMQWLADLEHHVVSDIDDVVDGRLALFREPLLQPLRRRTKFQVLQNRGRISTTEIWIGNPHRRQAVNWRTVLRVRQVGLGYDLIRESRHFTRNAQHRETVGPVGRQIEIEYRLAEVVRQRRANRRVIGQHEDPLVLVA